MQRYLSQTPEFASAVERRSAELRQLILVGARIMLTVLVGIPAVAGALVCIGCAVLLDAIREIGSDVGPGRW